MLTEPVIDESVSSAPRTNTLPQAVTLAQRETRSRIRRRRCMATSSAGRPKCTPVAGFRLDVVQSSLAETAFAITGDSRANLAPQLIATVPGTRGIRQDQRVAIFFANTVQRVAQLIAGKPVALCGGNQKWPSRILQEAQ